MYWALTTDRVDTRGFRFEQVLADIQTLNHWARAARLEVTAISLAAYPFVQEDYALLPHGASIGSGYGPLVVSREKLTLDDLRTTEIVVPGTMTTSFLVLRMVLGEFTHRELAFEQIPDEVASGRAEAGLIIHEGQLTFSEHGLAKVLDLGEWWLLETGLPLPLGRLSLCGQPKQLGDQSAFGLDIKRHSDERRRTGALLERQLGLDCKMQIANCKFEIHNSFAMPCL